MAITINIESFKKFRKEMSPKDHWIDAGNFQDYDVNPDWDTYDKLEDLGNLITFVARKNGEMVGYAVFLLSPYLHCKEMMFAENDLLFVKREYRKTGIAKQLLLKAIAHFKYEGVHSISFHILANNPAHGLAQALKFDMISFQYVRRLN